MIQVIDLEGLEKEEGWPCSFTSGLVDHRGKQISSEINTKRDLWHILLPACAGELKKNKCVHKWCFEWHEA